MSQPRLVYGICVTLAILLVFVGWIFTVGQTLHVSVSKAKDQLTHSTQTMRTQLNETRAIKEKARTDWQNLKGNTSQIFKYLDTRQTISDQLIQSLKTRIDQEVYVVQKEKNSVSTK